MFHIESGKPVRVAFYIRVSTDEQAKDGYGADMQLAGLKDMITYKNKQNNWVTDDEWLYKDLGCSGKDLNRPGYKDLIKAVEK